MHFNITIIIICSFVLRIYCSLTVSAKSYPSPSNSGRVAASEQKLYRRTRWTAEEEERLVALREQEMSWEEISELFPERSWQALMAKYHRLTPDVLTRTVNFWTEEEKKLLLELVEAGKSWEEIAEYFPGRTVTAVRATHNRLTTDVQAPRRVVRKWTAEEDELLLELAKARVPWEERVTHFDSRTLGALTTRYEILKAPGTPREGLEIFTSEEDDLIVEGIELGMTLVEISQLLDRSTPAIKRRKEKLRQLKRLDPSIDKGRTYTAADYELMRELVEKGMPWRKISAEYFPSRPNRGPEAAYRRYKSQKQREEETR